MSPQPTASDVHVDAVLTNISIAYMQDAADFVAGQVFPILPVAKQSDKYWTYTKADWFREEAQKRAPGTESAGSGYGISTSTYYADVFAVHKDIDDQIRSNADDGIDLERDAARWVARQLLMKLESQFITDFFTTSTWTGASTGNDQTGVAGTPSTDEFKQWNDISSTPIEDVTGWIDEVQEKTGKKPNTLVLGAKVATALKNHPDIIDRIKHTQRGVGTLEIVAELMGLDRILEARATRNTGPEGGTDSYGFYFGKNALLVHSTPTPSLLEATGGYIFAWTGYTGVGGVEGIGTGARTSRIRNDLIKADRIEGELAVDLKVVAADLGVYMASAVA